MIVQIVWLCACVGAVWVSGFFPESDRRHARGLAIAVLVNWLAVQTTFTAIAPQFLLGSIGLHYSAPEMWAVFDFLLGLYVVARWRRGWLSMSILAMIFVQELSHDGYKYGLIEPQVYLRCLDVALAVVLALFVYGGWRGAFDGLRHSFNGAGHARNSLGTAPAQARARSRR